MSPKLHQINRGQLVLLPSSISSVVSPIVQETTTLIKCYKIQEYDQVFLTLQYQQVRGYFSQVTC